MKTLAKTVAGLVCVAGLTLLFAPFGLAQEKGGKVTLNHNPKTAEFNGIAIHPGTKLSKEDAARLDAVLKRYDRRLYRIERYQNGKLVKAKGELVNKEKNEKGLLNVYVDDSFVREIANAKSAGITDYSVGCANMWNDQRAPLEGFAKGKEMNQQLLKEVRGVLEKYTGR